MKKVKQILGTRLAEQQRDLEMTEFRIQKLTAQIAELQQHQLRLQGALLELNELGKLLFGDRKGA